MLKRVLLSWDFGCAVIVAVVVACTSPSRFSDEVAGQIYSAGISVLSITFAVYFTALAVIIAAGDDDFVVYLREKDVYETLIGVFRFTLWLLFLALFTSFVLFVWSVVRADSTGSFQSSLVMIWFSFLSAYALFATMSSTRDALTYARYRVLFLAKKREPKPRAGQPSPTAPAPTPPSSPESSG